MQQAVTDLHVNKDGMSTLLSVEEFLDANLLAQF